ncbi:MAG TPA: branched-chain amino acid ABC transporter permease [Tepidisphaeraceae bacterium]|nr:branched-chain amino acid ABC transporter permease [Tepidisphaeraceae bacterium]
MTQFVQTLTDGIAVGSLYALIALGYTLVYGILQFINFAHSDIFSLGAWASFTVASALGLAAATGGEAPWYVGAFVLVAAMVLCGGVGYLVERFAYRPLRNAPRLNVLITAIGVSLLLQNLGQLELGRFQRGEASFSLPFGPYPKAMPRLLADQPLFTAAGVSFHRVDAAVLATAVVLMVGIQWLVYRTKIGLAMRAVSFSHSTAALMGVNVNRVVSFTFVLGAALAAAAGFLYAMKYTQLKQTADNTWVLLGLKAFVAAVVGGIGNIRGAMLGGLVIGLIEFFGVAYLSSEYRDVYVFSILILVLLARPSGILGTATAEKV